MAQLTLTPEETKELACLIECCLSELRTEIIHTDNWQFKDELKKRKQMLRGILERVNQLTPAVSGD